METVPRGSSSVEGSLMWLGVAAGDLTPMKHLAVSALRPYLQWRPIATKLHRHTPLFEDTGQHLPHLAAFTLLPARAPLIISKTDVFVRAVLVAPGLCKVSVAVCIPVMQSNRFTVTASLFSKLDELRAWILTSDIILISVLPLFILIPRPPFILIPRPPFIQITIFIKVLVPLFSLLPELV